MAEPQTHLPSIIDWLQLPCDAAAIEQMMHPERSPYACVGPPSAQYGIPLCLENPKIGRAYDAEVVSDRIAEDRPVFRYLLAQEM